MKIKRSAGSVVFDALNTSFLFVLMLVMVYPMLNILALSLSDVGPIDAGVVSWYPQGFNVRGYAYMLRDPELIRSYGWTIAYSLGGTFLTLTLTSLIAYPLSQSHFCLKKPVTFFLAVTMFVSGGIIPLFIIVRGI
ncbi:MAG TPA: carbohydrate ABC transporter permease, partial [Clostridia bacterium]|nr:carbohydrate ABC transporter permease [Clostridia bacterium]